LELRSCPQDVAGSFVLSLEAIPASRKIGRRSLSSRGGTDISMAKVLFSGTKSLCLVSAFLCCFLSVRAQAQSVPDNEKSPSPDQKQSENAGVPQRYRLNRLLPPSASQYYATMWGVDSLAVKSVESGEIIRFTYRVLDVDKAKVLNDKQNEPSLIDPGAGVSLVIPSLEKVGKLRQTSSPLAGKV